MAKPLVSVFISYYNDEKYLRQSIESVLNNDYKNFELILLNHATKDNCREIAHSYNDKRIIHIDMDMNYGAGGGILFEKMLDKASGKYIKTLCADDILRKDGLSKLVEYMENKPNIDFAFGNVEYIDKNGKDLKDNWFKSRDYFSFDNDEAKCIELYSKGISFLPYIGSIIKRETLLNININKTYVMLFDMSLWVSLLCKGYKIGYLDRLVCNYRIHDNQISALRQSNRAGIYSWFEAKTFYEYFLNIHNVKLAQKVWPDSRFVEQLKHKDDIPFFVAYNMFITRCPLESSSIYLFHLFENIQASNRVKKIFNYSVKEFRKDILNFENNPRNINLKGFKKFKHKIYSKPAKMLGIRDMSFLILHRLFNIVILKDLRVKLKNKKKYSL